MRPLLLMGDGAYKQILTLLTSSLWIAHRIREEVKFRESLQLGRQVKFGHSCPCEYRSLALNEVGRGSSPTVTRRPLPFSEGVIFNSTATHWRN
ncbi:hypothetical protein PCC7418_1351 [Halothece sp. PCC 7418]|nr:hypothetical protein PCC7418_1351 [Halothece sp. PCC 7418]